MTNQQEVSKLQIDRKPAVIALASLLVALIAMSFAGIFIRLSEFVVLGLWSLLNTASQKRQEKLSLLSLDNHETREYNGSKVKHQKVYRRIDLALLVAAGTLFWVYLTGSHLQLF